MLEICQIKKQYIQTSTDQHTHVSLGFYLDLPKDLPTSSILQESPDLDKRIWIMYNKYIIDSANLQLNISYENKKNLENTITKLQENENKDKNDKQLLLIFEDVMIEVESLLRSSWTRFYRINNDIDS